VTNKTSLTFNSPVGQNASDQTISVTASDNSAVNYTVLGTTQKGGGWLFATPTGITPGTITVSILSNNLPADTYTGFVTITAQGLANSPLAIPITLVVGGSGTTLTLSPQTLTSSAWSMASRGHHPDQEPDARPVFESQRLLSFARHGVDLSRPISQCQCSRSAHVRCRLGWQRPHARA